jgi:hypothetical protein
MTAPHLVALRALDARRAERERLAVPGRPRAREFVAESCHHEASTGCQVLASPQP